MPTQFPSTLGHFDRTMYFGQGGTVRRKRQPSSGAIVSSGFTVWFMRLRDLSYSKNSFLLKIISRANLSLQHKNWTIKVVLRTLLDLRGIAVQAW